MNRDLEDILKDLPLAQPSASLDRRVLEQAVDVDQPALRLVADHSHRTRRIFTATLTVGAMAAMLTIAAMLGRFLPGIPDTRPTPATRQSVAFNPVRNDTVVSHLADEGVFFLDEHTPVRQLRRQTIHRVQWVDDDRNITVGTTLPPREEVMLMPISFD